MRRGILWALLALLVLGGGGYGYWRWARGTAADPDLAVQAMAVRIQPDVGPMEEVLSAVGTLEPLTRIAVSTRSAGEVSEVAVKEGQAVEAGQLLVALDRTDLELAVTRARANLLSAQASLRKLQAGPSPAELLQQQNAVEQARIRVDRLDRQVAQSRVLADQGAVAPAELAQLEEDLAAARQDLRLAEQRLAELTAGPDPADLEVAQAQVAQAEADLALAQEELRWADIRSPLTGTVLSVAVEPGQTLQAGATVVEVGRLDRVRVTVPVHEIDVNRVAAGQHARIQADAAPGRIFEGSVTSVATVGAAQSGIVSFDVTVELENLEGLLRPGMTVDVEVVLDRKEDALRVPLEAVFRQQNRDMVLRLAPDGTALPTPIRVGLRDGRYVEVVEGLSPDDTLLLQAGGLPSPAGGPGGNRGFGGLGMPVIRMR